MIRLGPPPTALLVGLVVLSLIGAPADALPDGQWYRVEAAGATFYGSVDRFELTRFVEVARLLDAALEGVGPPFLDQPPAPTHLYIFRDAEAYRPYQHRDGGGPAFVDGTHFGRPHAGYVTLNAASSRAERALAHEWVHRRMRRGVPRWAEEGLAEVYASVHSANGRLWIGAPDAVHAEALEGDWLPIRELLSVDDVGTARYRIGRARTLFYAQSWLVVHYLWSDPERRADFVAALSAGRVPTLPDAPTLNAALRRHFEAGPPAIDVGAAPAMPPAPPRGDAMRYADVLFRLGDLLMIQGGRDDEAAEHFRTALGIDSGHGSALGGLAVLAERVGDRETARERFSRALELDPDDPLLRFRYGRSLLEPADSAHLGARFSDGRRLMREALDRAEGARWLRDAIGWVYLVRAGPTPTGRPYRWPSSSRSPAR